jgi:hypothetical protein
MEEKRKQPLTLVERQKRHQAKLKIAGKCLQLKKDVSYSIRIIEGAVIGLKTIAVSGVNGKPLLVAIRQIEAAIGLLNRERKWQYQ